jgi:hypothetical protein
MIAAGVIGVDPGYARAGGGCAIALLDSSGVLVDTTFLRPDLASIRKWAHACSCCMVAIEKPQADARTTDARIIIELAWQGAIVGAALAMVTHAALAEVAITDWKGSRHKPQHHYAVWQGLAPEEREVLGGDRTARAILTACERGAACRWDPKRAPWYPKSFATHNILDAVGIAKHTYQRLINAR